MPISPIVHVKGLPPASPWLSKPYSAFRSSGFTLVELVTVMLIVGILAAVAAPQFFDREAFASRGFYDEVISTLRYAQKSAIAQRRYVCVAFPASNSISLTHGTTSGCGSAMASASGAAYPLTNGHASFSGGAPTGFYFDALGRASASSTISITGYSASIIVEAETGYVHP
jgi:MSHA pilin protein MshC